MNHAFTANRSMLTLLACIFTLGTVSLIALVGLAIIGIAVGIAYVLMLALAVLHDLASTLTALYAGSDSAIRLLIIVLVCWSVYKVGRALVRSLRASFPVR